MSTLLSDRSWAGETVSCSIAAIEMDSIATGNRTLAGKNIPLLRGADNAVDLAGIARRVDLTEAVLKTLVGRMHKRLADLIRIECASGEPGRHGDRRNYL